MKKISIVMPSFNQAAYVEKAIRSVLDQGYENLEYVVVDGGSTDGSREIIERYRDRLAYYVSEPDAGHGNALNKGFARTTGEIMAWLNSDDMYVPWAFSTVSDIFEQHPNVNWIQGITTCWNDKGTMISTRFVRKNVLDYLSGNFEWIQQESVFWRRSLWERAGGRINESYKFMVDGELWSRFFRCDILFNTRAVLSGYRMHSDNRAKIHREECLAEMRRAIDEMRPHVDVDSLHQVQRGYPLLLYDTDKSTWRMVLGKRPDPPPT